MKDKELRNIPKKNYVILGIVVVATILLVYYLYMWYDAYMDTRLNKPILDKYMEVINYNELDDYLVETPNAIIYVSMLEDSEIRAFEKKLKGLFKSHAINRDILYMDITNEGSNVIDLIVNKYSLNITNDKSVPVILVIEDGKLKSIYDIKENNYDVDSLRLFIDNIIFLEEDEF